MKFFVVVLALISSACVPGGVVFSPVPSNPFDDRTWIEVMNNAADLVTIESRGRLVMTLDRGKSARFPLVAFRSYEQYNLIAKGFSCASTTEVKVVEVQGPKQTSRLAGCHMIGYQLKQVSVPYSAQYGTEQFWDVSYLTPVR